MLKDKLLATGMFIDNEYLDRYVELIDINRVTQKQRYKTQRHHIIPVCVFQLLNKAVDNSDTNLVNLLYKDHIIAHCLLTLSSKDIGFKNKMYTSVIFAMGDKYDTVIDILTSCELDTLQLAYEEGSKAHRYTMNTDSVRERIRTAVRQNRANPSSSYNTAEYHLKLSIAAMGNSRNKGKIRVLSKDGAIKYVESSDVESYKKMGYVVSTELSKVERDAICGIKKNKRHIDLETLHKRLSESHKGIPAHNKGKHCSEATKRKLSAYFKGTRWMNNGEIQRQVREEDIEAFLSRGFVFGVLKQ